MIGYFILGLIITIDIVGLCVFAYEIKNAPIVDSKKQFLHDDYYPNEGPTLNK